MIFRVSLRDLTSETGEQGFARVGQRLSTGRSDYPGVVKDEPEQMSH